MSRDAEIRLRANDRQLDQDLDKSRSKIRARMGSLGKDLARSIGGAMRGALDIAGLGGVASIVAAGRQVYTFQTNLTRLQISAGKTKSEMQALERQLFAVGKADAVDPDQLLAGAQAFTSLTGDLGTFTKGMDDLAKVSTATGASMDDLSKVAAALKTNLGVEGGSFGEAFDVLAKQGKTGAVELNELARELAGLTPQFATFGKTGVEGLRDLGAMLQLTRSGFGTTAEAATGLRAIMTNLIQNEAKFRKAGIKIFDVGPDGKKKVRELADIIFDVAESGMDETAMVKAFGSSEAYRALLPLMKAGRAEFEKMANIDAKGTIGKDFETFMDSSAGKMQSAGAAMKEAFNDALKDNIADIAKAMKMLADAIAWIGKHPYLAAAAFAGLRFGPGIVGAMLGGGGGAGASMLGGLLGGGGAAAGAGAGGAAAAGGAGGGALAAAGPAALVVAAGAAGYALGTLAERSFDLGERFSSLARNGTFETRDDQMSDDEFHDAAVAAQKRYDTRMQGVDRQRLRGELESYGYRGSISDEAIEKFMIRDPADSTGRSFNPSQELLRIRQAASAARSMGASPEDIRGLGTDELLRQFPLMLGTPTNAGPRDADSPFGPMNRTDEMMVDPAAFAAARKAAGASAINLPGYNGGGPLKVEVVIRMDDQGKLWPEVVDNAPSQARR